MKKLYVFLLIVCLCTAVYCVRAGQPLLAPAPLLMAADMAWLWWRGEDD